MIDGPRPRPTGHCPGSDQIGALVSATTFSFYPSKNLGAIGDGGAVTTDDDAIAERVRMLGNYGQRDKYDSELLGWNSRLDPLEARSSG